jgi:hypothetical protein
VKISPKEKHGRESVDTTALHAEHNSSLLSGWVSVLVRSSTCPVFPANRHQIMQAWIGYNLENYQLQLQGCITAVRVGRTLMARVNKENACLGVHRVLATV